MMMLNLKTKEEKKKLPIFRTLEAWATPGVGVSGALDSYADN